MDWLKRLAELAAKADLTDEEFEELQRLQVKAQRVKAQRDTTSLLGELNDAEEDEDNDEEDPGEDRIKALETEIAKLKAPGNRLGLGGEAPAHNKLAPQIAKYDHLTGGQTALVAGLVGALGGNVSENLIKACAVKALEDERPYEAPDHLGNPGDERILIRRSGIKSADAAFEQIDQAVALSMNQAIKANEAMYSTSSGFGDQWVTVQYSNALWPVIRTMNPVLERMNAGSVEVPQGTESITFMLESTDPTWYVVAQATATGNNGPTRTVTSSRLGTANKSLTVNKFGAAVPYSGEANEDSIIPLINQIEQQITVSGAEQLTSAILDGDTETAATTNINDIAGTAAGTEYFMLFNGLRKLALVTNTANARDAGVLSVDDYLQTLLLMGAAGKNAFAVTGTNAVSFIQDPNVNFQAMRLPEVKTRDSYSMPTIENGQLTSIWNREVITSYNILRSSLANTGYEYKTEATGKVDIDTAADNTKGSLLAVRWDQWKLGYKRRITLERDRYARADLTEIIAMMRVGLTNRDNEACAISYDITLS